MPCVNEAGAPDVLVRMGVERFCPEHLEAWLAAVDAAGARLPSG